MAALDLKHVRAVEEENRRLKARVEELQFEVKMLSSMGVPEVPMEDIPGLNLEEFTRSQKRILFALYARSPNPVHHEQIWGALYNDKPAHKVPQSKVVSAMICQLRKAIKGSRWQIVSVPGAGYMLCGVVR
jgi:DNA-binding response OmpR family regulator